MTSCPPPGCGKSNCGGLLSPEGDPQHETLMEGKAHEVHHFHRCAKCGVLWNNIIESGLGGHGNVWVKADDQRTRTSKRR
jgi:hypothetical protein